MIPAFHTDGNLPPGVHWTSWIELASRFGCNLHRRILLRGLEVAIESLRHAGCTVIYVDGSFVTSKGFPRDYDCCWNVDGVDEDLVDPVFFILDDGRSAQKAKYLGEWFAASFTEGGSGLTFLEFFQMDKATGNPKGIVALELTRST